jgi:hypothetical protein
MMLLKNRSAGVVAYAIPDLNIKRRFSPGETKSVSEEEVQKLSFIPGGQTLLDQYLQVTPEDATKLSMEPEREYFWDEEKIKDVMTNGSLDTFLDALDFAPVGVIDLIKDYAVKMPLTDTQKLDAIKEKTGFDAARAIENMKAVQRDSEGGAAAEVSGVRKRRVEEPITPTSKYKIIG